MVKKSVDMAQENSGCGIKCFSWSAVFVGALVGIGISFLLSLLNVALDLKAFFDGHESLKHFAVVGAVGTIVSTVVALYVAGWIAGCLGRSSCCGCCMGVLYGFTSWCVMLVAAIIMVFHIQEFIPNYPMGTTTSFVLVAEEGHGGKARMPKNVTVEEAPAPGSHHHLLSKGVSWSFWMFFLSAMASCFGGYRGSRHRKSCDSK